MYPWWLHTKRFGVSPTFQDNTRWKKHGNVYTLTKPDHDKDKWMTGAQFKTTSKLKPDEKLRISGVANANIVDRVQERIDPRGLDATDFLRNPQFLAHHSYYCTIGQVEVLDIQDDGVHFAAWIGDPAAVGGEQNLTHMQREMRSLIAQKAINSVSIGFIPHKFRAPVYNNNGDMEEPLVIEAWELLEISAVAVPCNQLSQFEVREAKGEKKLFFTSAFNPVETEHLKNALGNITTEELRTILQNSGAMAFADNNDSNDEGSNVAKKVPATKANPGTPATPPANNKGGDGDNSEDDDEENYEKEVITLLRTMNAGQSKTLEVLGDMMKHIMKGQAADDEEETEEEEDEKTAELETRIAALEDGQKDIASAIKELARVISEKKAA